MTSRRSCPCSSHPLIRPFIFLQVILASDCKELAIIVKSEADDQDTSARVLSASSPNLLSFSLLQVIGGCSRCSMITVDQKTGEKGGNEPLLALASFRREKVGIFLKSGWSKSLRKERRRDSRFAECTVEGALCSDYRENPGNIPSLSFAFRNLLRSGLSIVTSMWPTIVDRLRGLDSQFSPSLCIPAANVQVPPFSNDTGVQIYYLRAKNQLEKLLCFLDQRRCSLCLIFDTRCVLRMVNSQWLSLTLEVLSRFRVTETLYFELRTRGSSTGLRTLLLAVSCWQISTAWKRHTSDKT